MRHQLPSFIIKAFASMLFIVLVYSKIYSQSDVYKDSLEQIIKLNNEDSNTVKTLIELSFYIIEGQPATSLSYSKQALNISEKIKWDEGVAWSMLNVGLAYDYLANYDTAMLYYQQSFDKRASMNDRNGMASALMNAGGSYFYRGIYSIALDYFLKALDLYKSTRNEKGITRSLNNLGAVSRSKKDYQEALKYYMEAKKIREKNNDKEGMMVLYNNISLLFGYIGNYQASIEYAQKSEVIARELNKSVDLANALLNIGMGKLAFNKIDEAEKYLVESYQTINTTDDQQYRAFILAGLGELYIRKKQIPLSISYLDSSLTLAITQQRLELAGKCYKLLSTSYEKMGKQDKSLEYYKKFDELSDSLLNGENLRLMNEMNAIHKVRETQRENNQLYIDRNAESEKADRSTFQRDIFIGFSVVVIIISVLLLLTARKNIRIRKELAIKNELIEKALNEKEVLLKEIHHRVKNNLQLISSLLELQINRTNEKAIIDALVESQNRIESMSMIHKYLYSHENIGAINMKVYIEQLANQIEKTYLKPNVFVEKRLDIEALEFNLDTAVPLGIIATEIISNSYKYAFENNRNNVLSIELTTSENEYILTISDNGEKVDDEKLSGSYNSLGLKLISLLSKQLRAHLTMVTGDGLTFILKGKQL